jgi:hypothetical protein
MDFDCCFISHSTPAKRCHRIAVCVSSSSNQQTGYESSNVGFPGSCCCSSQVSPGLGSLRVMGKEMTGGANLWNRLVADRSPTWRYVCLGTNA